MDVNYAGKKITRLLGFAPDYWVFHLNTGLCTQLLGFAPEYWAIRLLGFAPEYWALHLTTGLCIRLLGFAPNYWALHPTIGLYSNAGFLPKSNLANPVQIDVQK